MVLVGYNKEQHVFLINFKYMTILLKRGVLVALSDITVRNTGTWGVFKAYALFSSIFVIKALHCHPGALILPSFCMFGHFWQALFKGIWYGSDPAMLQLKVSSY